MQIDNPSPPTLPMTTNPRHQPLENQAQAVPASLGVVAVREIHPSREKTMTAVDTDLRLCRPLDESTLTSEEYIVELIEESRSHPALNHPWLEAMAECSFPDMAWAVRDFAWHYHGYSSWFPHYLAAVIGSMDREEHRELLQENLNEENGELGAEERATLKTVGIDPETVDGVPHPVLFRRFCRAMGIGEEALGNPHQSTVRWRSRFRRFLESSSPAAGVGALGLGTESIVKHISDQILPAIRSLPLLSREDYVFFELHCVVDDQHQADLLEVAQDLITTAEARRELRRGMLTALDLRCQLWDRLYRRALGYRQAVSA